MKLNYIALVVALSAPFIYSMQSPFDWGISSGKGLQSEYGHIPSLFPAVSDLETSSTSQSKIDSELAAIGLVACAREAVPEKNTTKRARPLAAAAVPNTEEQEDDEVNTASYTKRPRISNSSSSSSTSSYVNPKE